MNLQKLNSRDPRVAQVVGNKSVTIAETERPVQITVYWSWAAVEVGDSSIHKSPKNWEILENTPNYSYWNFYIFAKECVHDSGI